MLRASRPHRTRSGLHQDVLLDVGDRTPLRLVVNDDELGGPVAVRSGDHAEARGRYFLDADGRDGLDWTHHGTSRRWPTPGYLIVNGRRYE